MAINMMCTNSICKYYWEDNCTRNLNEERIEIDENGKCETFEVGKSEWYEEHDTILCKNCGIVKADNFNFDVDIAEDVKTTIRVCKSCGDAVVDVGPIDEEDILNRFSKVE